MSYEEKKPLKQQVKVEIQRDRCGRRGRQPERRKEGEKRKRGKLIVKYEIVLHKGGY